MGVITSFLKLFKPAPNDYVDVEKHLNENYDKIDAWAKDLVVNDLTTGGADKAGSAEMVKKLGTEKLDKGNVPATLNNAEKIVAALQGNGGLKFDPDLLYLNDEGTKKVGYYYLDRLKNGIFECLVETTTTVNDSSKFRDISNKASADRLDNLIKNKKLYYIKETTSIDFNNYDNNIFVVSCVIENKSTTFTYLPFSFVVLKNNEYSMREIGHINNVTRGVSLTISNNIATITGDSTTAKLVSVVILAL